jgi:hypothetical protein
VQATYVCAIAAVAADPGGPGLGHMRIPGILQRIGLCYGLAGIRLVGTARRGANGMTQIEPLAIVGCIVTILLGYWILLIFVPVPGFGAGVLTPAGSLPGFVDRTLFTEPHLWPLGSATGMRPATYDPEGLLSTLPATANVLFGMLAAWALRRYPRGALGYIAAACALLTFGGLALDPLLVINKRTWTSSFAIFSSGISAFTLAALIIALRFKSAAFVHAFPGSWRQCDARVSAFNPDEPGVRVSASARRRADDRPTALGLPSRSETRARSPFGIASMRYCRLGAGDGSDLAGAQARDPFPPLTTFSAGQQIPLIEIAREQGRGHRRTGGGLAGGRGTPGPGASRTRSHAINWFRATWPNMLGWCPSRHPGWLEPCRASCSTDPLQRGRSSLPISNKERT